MSHMTRKCLGNCSSLKDKETRKLNAMHVLWIGSRIKNIGTEDNLGTREFWNECLSVENYVSKLNSSEFELLKML